MDIKDLDRLIDRTAAALHQSQRQTMVAESSHHVELLCHHAGKIDAPQEMLDFYSRLSEPPVCGGVVVLLERPAISETDFYGNDAAVVEASPTLSKIDELIHIATGGVLGMEAVTVFDAFPLQPLGMDGYETEYEDSYFINALLAEKRPEIVISCFRVGSYDGVLSVLQHRGVGKESSRTARSLQIWGGRRAVWRLRVVDAFHPGLSVNHHPEEEVFESLLILQFAKAFGEWCGTWEESPWMDGIRVEARKVAARLKVEA